MTKVLTSVLILFAVAARGDSSLFVGPVLGATTFNSSMGSESRDSQAAYGGEALYIIDHWMSGLQYSYFATGPSGSGGVNVQQSNQVLEGEVKFRLTTKNDFDPFVSVGGGGLSENAKTQIFEDSETSNDTFFYRDVGLGVMGKVHSDFGVSLSAKYYQFSNVSGFNYGMTLGYFPKL